MYIVHTYIHTMQIWTSALSYVIAYFSSPVLSNLLDPAVQTRIDFEAAGRNNKLKTATDIY